MADPVLELLQSKNVSYTPSGKDYLTKCFNPEHNDSNPSFRIDKVTGIAHCFSCGFKTNIFKFYGILTNNTSIKIAKLKEKLQALKEVNDGLAGAGIYHLIDLVFCSDGNVQAVCKPCKVRIYVRIPVLSLIYTFLSLVSPGPILPCIPIECK